MGPSCKIHVFPVNILFKLASDLHDNHEVAIAILKISYFLPVANFSIFAKFYCENFSICTNFISLEYILPTSFHFFFLFFKIRKFNLQVIRNNGKNIHTMIQEMLSS